MRRGRKRYRHRDGHWSIAGGLHAVHLLMSRDRTSIVRRDFVVLVSSRWRLLLLLVKSLEGVIAGGGMRRLGFFGFAPKSELASGTGASVRLLTCIEGYHQDQPLLAEET